MMTAPAIETKTLEFSTTINARMDHTWSMLTNRDDLCDWLCRDAHVHLEQGGFATLIWGGGVHAYGVFKEIVENEKIIMTWHDGTDQMTKVKFKLEEADDGIVLKLWHKGFTDDERAEYYQDFWDFRLRNLTSILETGEHVDIVERVIVGILANLSERTEENPAVSVLHVVSGYSAEAAGIQAGDLITAVDDKPVTVENGIHELVQGKKVGDEVTVTFQRDGQEHIVTVALKGHPIPPIPETWEDMAQDYIAKYERINEKLSDALEGVAETIAEFKPDDETRSIKEELAHLINRERHTLEWLATYANGPRRINPYYTEPARVAAIISVNPTLEDLQKTLKRTQKETVAMIRQFTPEMQERVSYRWWMAFEKSFVEITTGNIIQHIRDLALQAQPA